MSIHQELLGTLPLQLPIVVPVGGEREVQGLPMVVGTEVVAPEVQLISREPLERE